MNAAVLALLLSLALAGASDELGALTDDALERASPSAALLDEIARRAALAKRDVAAATAELTRVSDAALEDGELSDDDRRELAARQKALSAAQARADKLASLEERTRARLTAPPAPSAPAPEEAREAREAGVGSVTYVTASEAYVDVGRAQGFPSTGKVSVLRQERLVALCEPVSVSSSSSVCRVDRRGLKLGDRVVFAPGSPPPSPAPAGTPKKRAAAPRPPVPAPEVLAARLESVRSAPVVKVPFTAKGGDAFTARASSTLRQQVWAISTAPGGVFGRTSVDASAFGALTASPRVFTSGALRVVGDLIAPGEQRFRAGELLELYVWNASVGIDDDAVAAELGRFRPRKAPGAILLDGAQLGARFGTAEVGAYAGAVPDIITVAPAFDLLTAGLYFALDLEPTRGLLVLPRLRAAALSSSSFSAVRGELEAQTQLFWAGVGAVGGSFRASAGATEPVVSLDAARVDGDINVTDALQLSAGYRYLAAPALDFDALTRPFSLEPVRGAHRANASASWRVAPWLAVGAVGGVAYDTTANAERGYAGPEVRLPEAGVAAGYLEELGASPGRSAWLSTDAVPLSLVRLGARLSYFESAALDDSYRELGLMTLADAPLLPWLTLRARGFLQQALPHAHGAVQNAPTLVIADVALTGSL